MDKQDYKKLTRFAKRVGIKQIIAYCCAGVDWSIEDKKFTEDIIMTLLKCSHMIGERAGLVSKKSE